MAITVAVFWLPVQQDTNSHPASDFKPQFKSGEAYSNLSIAKKKNKNSTFSYFMDKCQGKVISS